MSQNKPQAEMKIGHYTLTLKLGEGIFSEIWLAEHTYLEGKETCLQIFTNEVFCKMLVKQKFLGLINNPVNFVRVDDYDPLSKPPYIAQEMYQGRNLRQLLREHKKFSPKLSLEILSKTIKSLRIMHEAGMAHLDLRPENIAMNKNGSIKLMDYITGKVSTLTIAEYYKSFANKGVALPKPIIRSLLYKNKRQRLGQELGISADIFSLGIVLFEMATGTYPSRKAEFPSQLNPNLPRKIDQIYAHCCGKADSYFNNCDEILEAIESEEIDNNVSPGVRLLKSDAAIVSVTTLAGGKHYVDGKNIELLSKNLDDIILSKLRFFAFDLSNIDYLNSSAIGFLVNFCDKIHNMGGNMVMFNVDKKVMTILGALGLEKVINIVETVQEAEKAILAGTEKS